jgi:hypothetical protein
MKARSRTHFADIKVQRNVKLETSTEILRLGCALTEKLLIYGAITGRARVLQKPNFVETNLSKFYDLQTVVLFRSRGF